jgi:drug/metabolite transporter (DMT)-like permease
LSTLSLPLLLAAAAAFGWSFCDLTRRVAARRMPAWPLAVWVTLGALPILAAWCVAEGAWRLEPARYVGPGLGAIGINLLANFAFFRSLQLAPLSVTLPMLSLTPAFSLGLGALVLGEELEPRALAGAALVVAGAFLLAWRRGSGDGAVRRLEPGSLLMGLVALAWSTTLLLDKIAMRHAAPPLHALIVHGGVALAGLAVLAARRQLATLCTVRGNAGLLAATVAFSVFAFGAQLYAVRDLPIGLVDTLKRAVGGALAVVWDRAFFGEPVTAGKALAVALLSVGVALLTL